MRAHMYNGIFSFLTKKFGHGILITMKKKREKLKKAGRLEEKVWKWYTVFSKEKERKDESENAGLSC